MAKPLPHKPPRFDEQRGEFVYELGDHDEIVRAELERECALAADVRAKLAQLTDAFAVLQDEHAAALVHIAQLRREIHALLNQTQPATRRDSEAPSSPDSNP